MTERVKLDRRLFEAAVAAYGNVPAVLRSVSSVESKASGDVAVVEITVKLSVPVVLVDPAVIEELRGGR